MMLKRLLYVAILLPIFSFGAVLKPLPNTYVNDFAHVLTKAQIRILNKKLYRLEKERSVQMAIILVNKIPADYQIEDYALLIGRKWHVGIDKKGLVYVAAIKQHKQRLEVADGLEKLITDDKAASILSWITVDLKHEYYNKAMLTLINDVDDALVQAKLDKISKDSVAKRELKNKIEIDKQADNVANIVLGTLKVVFIYIPAFCLLMFIILRLAGFRAKGGALSGSSNTRRSSVPMSEPDYTNDSFAAGAAIGYAAAERKKRQTRSVSSIYHPDHHHYSAHTSNDSDFTNEDKKEGKEFGNWGDGNNTSSGNSGFNGGGASSDW